MNLGALGLRLAKSRRDAGLTQRELATRMGTTQSAIARVESGAARPSLDYVERFTQATGVPLTIEFGKRPARAPSVAVRRMRVQAALGDFVFDPWLRNPSRLERQALEARGLTRDYFQSKRTAS